MSNTPVQNISGQDRTVPWLGGRLVVAGAVVEVPSDQAESFLQQEDIWGHPEKTSAKAAKKTAESPATTQED